MFMAEVKCSSFLLHYVEYKYKTCAPALHPSYWRRAHDPDRRLRLKAAHRDYCYASPFWRLHSRLCPTMLHGCSKGSYVLCSK
jgi:hypothetical protein